MLLIIPDILLIWRLLDLTRAISLSHFERINHMLRYVSISWLLRTAPLRAVYSEGTANRSDVEMGNLRASAECSTGGLLI